MYQNFKTDLKVIITPQKKIDKVLPYSNKTLEMLTSFSRNDFRKTNYLCGNQKKNLVLCDSNSDTFLLQKYKSIKLHVIFPCLSLEIGDFIFCLRDFTTNKLRV